MLIFKYGILIKTQFVNGSRQWGIAIFGGTVAEHEHIEVVEAVFEFSPSLGDSVKVGFETTDNSEPSIIKRCADYEWIRDVKVTNSTVVIYGIVHLFDQNLKRTFRKRGGDGRYHYIFTNDQTDFGKVSIPKEYVDYELSHRSDKQKAGEPIVYRVGICYEPTVFENDVRVDWRFFEDSSIIPIFELYGRDSMLPYLSESMVYGALEGIVIAINEDGALFWTPRMGCSILSSVTSPQMPSLGSVNLILVKRCLPDSSFDIPCFHELLPSILPHQWPNVSVVTDTKNGCVYLEVVRGKCVRLMENDDHSLCMDVPHLGKIKRGLESYWHKLKAGEQYNFRIEFQLIDKSYEPVIVDLQMKETDFMVKCRVVYATKKWKTYYAVLDSRWDGFDKYKRKIDFISISFRTLFCSQRIHIDSEQILQHSLTLLVRAPIDDHDTVEATHVEFIRQDPRDNDFRMIRERVWVRTTVEKISERDGQIDLLSPRLSQIFTDLSSVSVRLTGTFAIFAQFALSPGNVPMFLVRSAAPTFQQLPVMNDQLFSSLPPIQDVFKPIYLNSSQVETRITSPTPPVSPPNDEQEDRFSGRSSRMSSVGTSRTVTPIQSDHSEVATIMDESEYRRRMRELLIESPSRSTSLPDSEDSDNSFDADVINESWLASSEPTPSIANSRASKAVSEAGTFPPHRPSRFGYDGGRFIFSPTPRKSNTRSLKFGIRKLTNAPISYQEALFKMCYKYKESRPMFVENATEAVFSWMHRPAGKLTKTKKRSVIVYIVELKDYSAAYKNGKCNFTRLARCFTKDDMDIMEKSFVVPLGGDYKDLPKNCQMGQRLTAIHYAFSFDRMVRLGGHSFYIDGEGLQTIDDYSLDSVCHEKTTNKGFKWVQIETTAFRPTIPFLKNEVFEIWEGFGVPGFVIVEMTDVLKNHLKPLSDEFVHDVYSLTIEPLPGGPIDIASIDKQNALSDESIIFWRMVVEFTNEENYPKLLDRRKNFITPAVKQKIERVDPKEDIDNYGMYKTMAINQQLAQERVDRLRALGDPRVKMCEGPDLKPEIAKRKVDVDSRRENMLTAMSIFLKGLPELKENGFFVTLEEGEVIDKIDKCKTMHDDYHPHQFKKRMHSLAVGSNYVANLLADGKTYKFIYESGKCREVLLSLADCLGLNSTFIKKSEDIKRMMHYMYQKKLHSYM